MSWNDNKDIRCPHDGRILKDKGWKWECPVCDYILLDAAIIKERKVR